MLAKVPELDPQSVEDVIVGCGQPAGEAGSNIARVAAILAGMPDVPGVTVNRYCSSSLQTIRMAAHAIRAGEGDVFVAAGVETVSRFASGASTAARPPTSTSATPGAHGPARRSASVSRGRRQPGLPDIYIAMGQTAENVAEIEKVTPPRDGRVRGAQPRPRRGAPGNGFFEREITPVTLPDGTVVTKDDGPRAGTTVERLATLQAGVPRGRQSPPATPVR